MIYKEFRNEIPYNTIRTWSDQLMKNTAWQFVGWAGPAKEPYRHWAAYPDLVKGELLSDIWECINESLVLEGYYLKPERVILNLFNHGDSSWVHKDSDEGGHTVILFLNDYWDINWGGDFALFDKDGEIIQAFTPTPGKFVIFKASTAHGARPVSREAPYPRFGVAFQCEDDSNLQKLQRPKISPISTTL